VGRTWGAAALTAADTLLPSLCRLVADLGCGTGMLGIAAGLLGAAAVVGLDTDADALAIARHNVDAAGVDMELLRVDVTHLTTAAPSPLRPLRGMFDTVVTNPPFGTRVAGVDTAFVAAAHALTTDEGVVYSLHKTSTRAHWPAVAASLGSVVSVVAELRFELPATYAFHSRDTADVAVDLLRWVKGPSRSRSISAAHVTSVEIVAGSSVAAGASGQRRAQRAAAAGPGFDEVHGRGAARDAGGRGGGKGR